MPSMSRKEGMLAHAWYRARMVPSFSAAAIVLAACATQLGGGAPTPQPGEPTSANASVGEGQVRIAMILPLIGARQCRHRGTIDEKRRGNGARRVQGAQCPASRERRWRHVRKAPKAPPSRRSPKAQRSSSARSSRNRSALSDRLRARAIFRSSRFRPMPAWLREGSIC